MKVSRDPNKNWANDAIQFPRLLAEISYVGLNAHQLSLLRESMDLETEDIDALFDRAETRWQEIKAQLL